MVPGQGDAPGPRRCRHGGEMRSPKRIVVTDTGLVQRISVVGNSGSGKTTIARRLAAGVGLPHPAIDAIFHQPDLQPLATNEVRLSIFEIPIGPPSVVAGNHS